MENAKKVKRRSLKKGIRFDVFHRDGFACQYCGATPPSVVLQVDHLVPVAKGGSDEIDNLITACQGCNAGKSAKDLAMAPISLGEKQAIAEERELQIKEYKKLQAKILRRQEKDVEAIEAAFQEHHSGRCFTDSMRQSIRRNFLTRLDVHELCDDMRRACWKCRDAESAVKYFCGICWGKIRDRGLPRA